MIVDTKALETAIRTRALDEDLVVRESHSVFSALEVTFADALRLAEFDGGVPDDTTVWVCRCEILERGVRYESRRHASRR